MKTLQRNEEKKTLQCLHFLSIAHGVMTYVCINYILAIIIIIMFIYLGIVVIWDPWILICHPTVTTSGGKGKSAGLNSQQCPQNEHYYYIVLLRKVYFVSIVSVFCLSFLTQYTFTKDRLNSGNFMEVSFSFLWLVLFFKTSIFIITSLTSCRKVVSNIGGCYWWI